MHFALSFFLTSARDIDPSDFFLSIVCVSPDPRCRYVDRLERIHAHVKEAEEETQLSRREFVKSMKKKLKARLKEMQQESHKEEEEILVRRRTNTVSKFR